MAKPINTFQLVRHEPIVRHEPSLDYYAVLDGKPDECYYTFHACSGRLRDFDIVGEGTTAMAARYDFIHQLGEIQDEVTEALKELETL